MNTEIRTNRVDLVSDSTSVEIFNPMTEALSTADIVSARFGVWLSGVASIKVRPGLQFSVDGVNWTDSPAGMNLAANPNEYTSAVGWTFDDGTWKTIASVGATQRLFVRFGLMALNTTGTQTEGAQAQLVVQVKPQVARTLTAGPLRAWGYSTSTRVFVPMTGWVPAEQCATIRGTVELAATSGNLGLTCAWQQANEPSVPGDWSTVTTSEAFGTEQTANGISFAAPPGATVTKKYLRFGVLARNTTSSAIEACQATIRVDVRG